MRMIRSGRSFEFRSLLLVLALALVAGQAAAQIGPGPFAAFPSQSTTDGRFLGFGCPGTATFEQGVSIGLAVPADQSSFTVSLFDGDTGKTDALGRRHWDLGTRQIVFSIYADPLRQLNTSPDNLVGSWKGNDPNALSGPFWTASAATMANNDWWGVTITTAPQAQAPSGNYFYTLVIQLDGNCNPGESLETNLKIAASNPMAFLVPRFGLVAPMRQAFNDGPILYPGATFPPPGNNFLAAPTTYDGTFEFFFSLPPGETDLQIYDGDFDYGTANLTASPSGTVLTPCTDIDDADTPPTYDGFPFSTVGVSAEAATGAGVPADDSVFDAFRRGEPGSPGRVGCVRYEVTDPTGITYRNDNPSGSFEWEQFRIASQRAFDAANSDYTLSTDYLPDGLWKVRLVGLDLSNLNFVYANACSTRLEGGTNTPACPAVSVYLVGDTAWYDTNGNGVQDSGEAGIPGVVLELLSSPDKPVLATMVTGETSHPNWTACRSHNTGLDEQGLYCFGVDEPGDYLIRVAPQNFQPGGALYGYEATNGNQLTGTLVDGNVLSYDFGYRGSSSLGDRVWLDTDGDGLQDAGEAGLSGVGVELVDAGGSVVAATSTDADGLYLFDGLRAGSYTVRIVTATLPAGLAPSFDLDGTGTASVASLTLGVNTSRTDVDFGYAGTGSLGDRVWKDLDGNGVQESGEVGLDGVTVQLVDTTGNLLASTVTGSNGSYIFTGLLAGTYGVRIGPATLPASLSPTFDVDGTGSANTATVGLAAGAARVDVDFGYRYTPAQQPGTGTIGYWKNHPEAWPVEQITVGGKTYSKSQAISLMETPSRGDKTIDLFKQLVASKLSVMIGNNLSCIATTIAAADSWLVTYPAGSGVKSSNSAWAVGGPLHEKLDAYNNGRLCAPHRG